jgi:hypothetical protein
MTYFTDSPFERLMRQVPKRKRADEVPLALPQNLPCKTCRYNHPVCIGALCKQKMKNTQKERKQKHASEH